MTGLRKPEIADRLKRAIESSEAVVVEGDFKDGTNTLPWLCRIRFPAGMERNYTMYFWTVSHGGRGRASDEYRIQTTLKENNELEIESGTTLLLGWYDPSRLGSEHQSSLDCNVIVAWNALDRLQVGKSSSCQVKLHTINEAVRAGVASHNRILGNEQTERVLAVREDYFVRYLIAASGGHQSASVAKIKNSSYVRRQLRS